MEHTTSNDGTVIGFSRSGTGRPLLLVHGTTADHTRWTPILPQFERHFTVYAMDRRGRGESGDSPHYDLMREAEDVAAVVEAIGGPVFVLGHSYGGFICLEAALLTDGIERLVLYEPPLSLGVPLYSQDFLDRIQGLIDRGELEATVEVMFREIVEMPEDELEVYRRLPVWKTRVSLAPTIPRELAAEDSYRFDAEKFSRLSTPTLLLLGGESPRLFTEITEIVDSALPNSRMVVMPGQRHIAMDTNPELFVKEVVGFLLESS